MYAGLTSRESIRNLSYQVSAKLYPSSIDGWKFMAILIGANDLCTGCPSHMDSYVDMHIRRSIDLLTLL